MKSIKFKRGIDGFIDYKPIVENITKSLVNQLDELLDLYGKPIKISSVYPSIMVIHGVYTCTEISKNIYNPGLSVTCLDAKDTPVYIHVNDLSINEIEALYVNVFNFVMKVHFKNI